MMSRDVIPAKAVPLTSGGLSLPLRSKDGDGIHHRCNRWTPAFAGVTASVFVFANAAMAVEVKPVVQAQLLGGQDFYQGAESSFGGFASLIASPFMKFNDQWSLVPLYSGVYQGTKQVQDLIGGGTLFQDSQNHNISVKGIRSFENGLRLKAVTGYGSEFLRETEDEDWGDGLYDNRRLSAGAESEWFWKKDNFVRFAYDYFRIDFPNYQSLSSEAASVGQGREFNAPDVHNTQNHMLTLGSQFTVPGNGLLEAAFSNTWTSFPDQHLVDASGSLVADLRDDRIETLSLMGTWPILDGLGFRIFSSLGYSRTHLFSNQNHYDASRTFYNPNYYSYVTNALKNDWTLLLGPAPLTVNVSGAVSRQSYTDRLVQDSSGAYGTDTTDVDYVSAGLTVSYPIARNFQVKATSGFGWSDSNNTYSQLYQYHFNSQNYLMGFSYAY